jgi:6-pyruvoyltetrahydropterin/6-carboxytetrahydropterin synthase
MYEQSYNFTFEAAHELAANATAAPGHAYSRLHGHSFAVTLTLRAESLGEKGWIVDFAELRGIADGVKAELDHRLLNEIKGLERPTLENIARWIFERAAEKSSMIARVDVARPTLNERVAYTARA